MIPPEAIEEIRRLNSNLENLHRDAGDLRQLKEDLRPLLVAMKGMGKRMKGLMETARQLRILNQILLQAGKHAGTVGMIQTLLEGIIGSARARR